MSTVRKIAKNTSLLVAANIINLAMGFIINIYIARYFDVDKFGMVNWAINLATVFTLVTDLGIGMFLAIELPRYPDRLKNYLSNALTMKLCLYLLAFAGVATVAFLGGLSGYELTVLYVITLYVIIMAIAQLFQSVFQAFQSMEYIAVCQVASSIVLVAGTIAVVSLDLGIVAFSLVYLVAGLTVLGYTLLVTALSYTWPTLGYDRDVWKHIFLGGIPLSLAAVFSYLYFKLDIQLIEMLASNGREAVGYYSAAFKLIEAAIVLPTLYSMVIYPLISLYFHKKDSNLGFLLKKSIKYFYMLGAPIAAGTILMAPSFIYFLYSNKYEPSIAVLQMLGLGLFFIYVNSIPAVVMTAANMQVANVKINAVCLVLNVVLNLLLIPAWGIVGSAFSMVITQFAIGLLIYMVLRWAGYRYIDWKETLKIAACTLLMGLYVYYFREFNMAFVIVSAAAIYAVSILVSGTLTKEDITLALSIIDRKTVENKVESR